MNKHELELKHYKYNIITKLDFIKLVQVKW